MDRLVQPLQIWLRARLGPASLRVVRIVPFSGGASNLTCRVDLAGGSPAAVVLRLQRDEGIFAPYDVLREGRVLDALRDAPFPVPKVLAREHDPVHLGAPFLILEYFDAPHMGEAGPEADFGAFVRTVAQIHSLDLERYELSFLGVPAGVRGALVEEIEAVARRMARFGCEDDPLLGRAREVLKETIPEDGDLRLCQGDINVFNYLFRAGRLVAVVDWEQAKISDPRGDVGQLVALSHLKGAPFGPPRELGFVAAYEAETGRELTGLEWFRAFWFFQLGVIFEGWVAFNESAPWYSRGELDTLLELSLAYID